MDDDLFHIIAIAAFALIIFSIIGMAKVGLMVKTSVDSSANCAAVVDILYDQCKSEGNISVQTLKGRSVTLSYDRGVCIIK